MKKCVVFGNCQAEMLAAALRLSPGMRERYDVVAVQDWLVDKESFPGLIAGIDLFVVQKLFVKYENYDWFLAQVPAETRRVSYPVLWFTGIWPYWVWDLKTPPEEGYPWGRFGYGDRFIHDMAKLESDPDRIVEAYLNHDAYRDGRAQRQFEKSLEMTQVIERDADVQITPWILGGLHDHPMFETPNHPHPDVMREIGNQVLQFLGIGGRLPSTAEAGAERVDQLPIHPAVARGFGLHYINEATTYLTDVRAGTQETARSYYRRYAEYCARAHREAEAAA